MTLNEKLDRLRVDHERKFYDFATLSKEMADKKVIIDHTIIMKFSNVRTLWEDSERKLQEFSTYVTKRIMNDNGSLDDQMPSEE